MKHYGIILFHTTSAVMRAEKLMNRERFFIKLISTPRQFSSDCGIAIMFDWNSKELIKDTLKNAEVEFVGIHSLSSIP